jgi:uncharacterized membrane protein SpoIIM required for sporulation
MLKKILIFTFTLLCFTSNYNNSLSYYSKEDIRLYYDKFYEKLEAKYDNKEDILSFLSKLNIKINLYISKTKNSNNLKVLNDLSSINENKINSLN